MPHHPLSEEFVSNVHLPSFTVHLHHPKPKQILPVLFCMSPLVHPGSGSKLNLTEFVQLPSSTTLPLASDFAEFLILFYLQGSFTAFPQKDFLNSSKSNCLTLICPPRASLVSKNLEISRFFFFFQKFQDFLGGEV